MFGLVACGLGLWPVLVQFQVQFSYDQFASAYERNDVAAMLAVLDSDYTLTNGAGVTIDRQSYERQLTLRYLNRESVAKYTVSILVVAPTGTGVRVHTREIYTDRANHTHEYEDMWRQVEGRWKLTSTRTLKEN